MGMCMTRKIYRETRQLVTEDERIYKLNYFLTQKKGADTGRIIYGIAVTKESSGTLEEDMVDNLSYDQEEVEGILIKLANNLVTPLCLVEVIDGLITDRINV